MNDVPKPAYDDRVSPPKAGISNEPRRLLRLDHVLDRVPVSRATIYLWMNQGRFPKQISIGRAAFWRESDVTAWIEDKTAA